MTEAEIRERINSFPRWHYELDLGGQKTPIFAPAYAIRHRERRGYFFDPLVKLLGGSLSGRRVLDLGCNAGFWSLAASEAGADFVLGIDGRQMHVDQANFVFQAKGVDSRRYAFRHANLFDLRSKDVGEFDIVLCLGVFYHISKHMSLLEFIAEVNKDMLVIDTEISRRPGVLLEIRRERLDEPRNAIDHETVMVPSRLAVLELVRQFGYRAVTLKPEFADWAGSDDFLDGRRRAFVCAKHTPLAGLSVESEQNEEAEEKRYLMNLPGKQLLGILGAKLLRRIGVKREDS